MTDKDKIFQFFDNEFPFNKEGLEEFVATLKVKHYKKGELLLKEQQHEKSLRFLDKGIVRDFYATEGKEMNIDFYVEPCFISDLTALTQDAKTKKNQECLSDVSLRILPRDEYLQFLDKYECGQNLIHTIFQRIIKQKEEEAFKHFSQTPDERYLELLEKRPEWLQLIPQYHIASYLRVTPETLSRIRKRV